MGTTIDVLFGGVCTNVLTCYTRVYTRSCLHVITYAFTQVTLAVCILYDAQLPFQRAATGILATIQVENHPNTAYVPIVTRGVCHGVTSKVPPGPGCRTWS